MRLLLIPDKFKGSLTNEAVANAIMEGVKQVHPKASFHFIKASDGGDGFLDAIENYKDCEKIELVSQDPLGKQIQSYYLYDEETTSAYIELANASGMELLVTEKRNPTRTSTYGTGIQIKDAVEKGAKKVYIGLGGSATNDGGIGIANALGYNFIDSQGNILKPVGENLSRISGIEDSKVLSALKDISFYAVNDVTNPLYGKNGAAQVYARQKGASDTEVVLLDNGLKNLASVVENKYKKQVANVPGSGAAGGTAYGLKSFLNAEFVNGINFVLQLFDVESVLSENKFDYIITGEGKIDEQTLNGKLIQGVLDLGRKYDIPVMAVCGKLDVSMDKLEQMGIQVAVEIQDPSKDLEYNMKNAYSLTVKRTVEVFKSGNKNNKS